MDFRRRIYARCYRRDDTVDLGAFLQHLLLFEQYIIESAPLLEKECAEFREWLRSLDRVDDGELHDRIRSLKARVGSMLAGVGGRVARFLASAIDPTPGIASGAGNFFVDKVFARPGPIVFLNDQLPSVFAVGP